MIPCMYVIEEHGLLVDKFISNEAKRKLRRDAENKLSEKVNSILRKEDNTPFELIITSGKVHQKFLEKSCDLKAQTIVMGRSSSKELGKQRIGSNTKKIIAKAQVLVIVTSNNKIAEREHIILPLDLLKPIGSQVQFATDTALLLDADVSVIVILRTLADLEYQYSFLL